MSAQSGDDTLERLNYFNGQRLAAGDFRAEQAYHLGVRRLLNRSLYSAGIVKGLEVLKHPNDKHKVVVRGGLAFDHLGREIALLADAEVQVRGAPSTTKGVVFGNLLVVSYREQRTQPVSDGCMVAAPYVPCSGDLAWGAPTRIASDVVFEFLDSMPADDSGKVVLAQVELSATCTVERVLPGVRRYAMPVKPQQVRTVSLEGEKDIDSANPKTLYFHVDGGYPSEVTLYLRARKFSSLYYTELGKHSHGAQVTINPRTYDLTHDHTIGNATTGIGGAHAHAIWVDVKDLLVDESLHFGVDSESQGNCDWVNDIVKGVDGHSHDLKNLVVNNKTLELKIELTGSATIANQGVTDVGVRVGNKKALTYVDDLRIFLDGQDITTLVLQQLSAKPGQAASWAKLGDGSNAHAIALPDGTGAIDLLKLGIEIGLGQHKLEFRLNQPDVGGCVQYNLYVS